MSEENKKDPGHIESSELRNFPTGKDGRSEKNQEVKSIQK